MDRRESVFRTYTAWVSRFAGDSQRDRRAICFTDLTEAEANYLRDLRKRVTPCFGVVEIRWDYIDGDSMVERI